MPYQTSILVTAGAGFIGGHACKALARRGYVPITYDDLSRGRREAVKWGQLEVGDIADQTRVREVMERHRPAAVMHFAAFAYVGESVENPLLYYRNNVSGTTALLEAISRNTTLRVLLDLRDLWHSAADTDHRGPSADSDQSLRSVQADH
jgi:UDP-glucose 4-epimerase